MRTTLTLFLLVLATAAAPVDTQPYETEVRQTLSKFVRAFDNLDWEQFRGFFADDATVFYPREVPSRATGRKQIEAQFEKVFQQIRGKGSKPPYMDLQPRDLNIQFFGDVAVATFHLDDRPGVMNRRTIVLYKNASSWKIVHIHASEVALPKPQS
jgi:ketosteroid isomerase-like protein